MLTKEIYYRSQIVRKIHAQAQKITDLWQNIKIISALLYDDEHFIRKLASLLAYGQADEKKLAFKYLQILPDENIKLKIIKYTFKMDTSIFRKYENDRQKIFNDLTDAGKSEYILARFELLKKHIEDKAAQDQFFVFSRLIVAINDKKIQQAIYDEIYKYFSGKIKQTYYLLTESDRKQYVLDNELYKAPLQVICLLRYLPKAAQAAFVDQTNNLLEALLRAFEANELPRKYGHIIITNGVSLSAKLERIITLNLAHFIESGENEPETYYARLLDLLEKFSKMILHEKIEQNRFSDTEKKYNENDLEEV